ncbi:MAG: hypothetical protein OEW68_01665 [Gammaproteobacteria bacterium]|nr:hypothetical protein [Gammaproteobacteria bacterium]MDH4313533.1 hypothetical protein [Gammaproteobacteria bacterium]MDH5500927.1 hypothetical protein [Gammaproteobacteria bacterium]
MAGATLILGLPTPAGITALLLGSWLCLAWHESAAQWHGYRKVAAIRIDKEGFIETIDTAGRRCPAELVGGSFVLQRMAWLRLRLANGQCYAELLVGDGGDSDSWHWLQLMWRQNGAHVGRMD